MCSALSFSGPFKLSFFTEFLFVFAAKASSDSGIRSRLDFCAFSFCAYDNHAILKMPSLWYPR